MRRIALLFVLFALALLGACQDNTIRLEPNKGSVEGGDTISLFGGPFGPGVRVEFGGQPVGTVTVASPSELRIVVPRGEKIGPVDVIIIDAIIQPKRDVGVKLLRHSASMPTLLTTVDSISGLPVWASASQLDSIEVLPSFMDCWYFVR